jgi:hypothetical protein
MLCFQHVERKGLKMKKVRMDLIASVAMAMLGTSSVSWAGNVWWNLALDHKQYVGCSVARWDDGTLDSPALQYHRWYGAGVGAEITDHGNEVIVTSGDFDAYYYRTKESCLVAMHQRNDTAAADKAKIDTYR